MDRLTPVNAAHRFVPHAYLVLAHLALGTACAVILWDSSLIAGFFYHPKMIAAVHTLTLGWISSTLIAIQYVAAGRSGLRLQRLDIVILIAWAAGASGVASHFWIEEFSGMAWSAGLLGLAIVAAGGRFGMAFAVTPLPAPVKLQLNLAWLNLAGTAFIGLLLGINKTRTVLPGYNLHNVYAHAHLAVLGWAFMASVALAHLFLLNRGGSMPATRWSMHGTVVTQLGVAGIFVSLLTGEPYVPVFGVLALAGMTVCLGSLVAHARSARRPATRSGSVVWAAGLAWLLVAAGIGLSRLGGPGEGDPAWIMAYGVAGVLAGLGQMVCGLCLDWWPGLNTGRGRAWPAVAGWSVTAPLLVVGLAGTYPVPIAVGAAGLLFAVLWTARSIFSAANHRAA